MDEIRIDDLKIYAYHGVNPEENVQGQNFYVSAVLYTDTRPAGLVDDLALSTHYGHVAKFIHRWMGEHTCKLLETVAEQLAREILLQFPHVQSLDLEIKKPEAPIKLPFGCVSVKIHRGWHRAYLSIGSNLGDRAGFLEGAVRELGETSEIKVEKCTKFYETKAYGGVEQGDFLNGAVELRTLLGPEELLERIHEIERHAHRERTLRWGPRTLDLDIVFYDKLVYESETLIIPHVDMEHRTFVLEPLCELAPNYRHPILGKTVRQLLQELQGQDISV